MNIAISGASGKIGKEVCKYLKYFEPNIKIRLGSRTFSNEIICLKNELQNVTWQKLDIENIKELEAFYVLWTQKESYLKWLGKGLSQDIKSFSVNPEYEKISEIKNIFKGERK